MLDQATKEKTNSQEIISDVPLDGAFWDSKLPDNTVIYNAGVGVGGTTCFTFDSMVTMADGTLKKICDVQVGEYVYNHNKTSINKVTLIEKTKDLYWGELYTPTNEYAPFATTNHPLYINGVLSSIDPTECYRTYPWLGKTAKLEPVKVTKSTEEHVYNLWLDGDGTYIINGFGTTSIIGDGGIWLIFINKGIMTADDAIKTIHSLISFVHQSPSTAYGAKIISEIVCNLLKNNNKILKRIAERRQSGKLPPFLILLFVKLVGSIALLINKLKGK